MKVISYDVGIRNMAYCIFVVEDGNIAIQDWNIINLMEKEESHIHTCCFEMVPPKNKVSKKTSNVCGKKAKYEKNDQCFCLTHAKKLVKDNGWLLPTTIKISDLKKKSLDELYILGIHHSVFQDLDKPKTKKACIALLTQYFQDNLFTNVSNIRKNAGEINLITLGISMKGCLDHMENVESITHVIIENQISPIATRMKTIQGMLAQYYIMKYDTSQIKIEFISSSNKLKHLVKTPNTIEPFIDTSENTYKQHKQCSVYFCKQILENNPSMREWMHVLDTSKKDDLADCFLQGLYYLQNQKVITYAENLKINCITLS